MKLSQDPWANRSPSLAAKLAAFFQRHPNEWIDGRTLSQIAGYAAWRTRCSDLRRAPFNMMIVNRQKHVEIDGGPITISEYKFVVQGIVTEASAVAGVISADHSV